MRQERYKRMILAVIAIVSILGLTAAKPESALAGICGATPCVDSSDIINGQVTGTDLSSSVMVNSSRIVDGSVTSTDIQDGSIGSSDIQDGTVGSVDVGFNYASSSGKGGPASDLNCVGCVSQTELNFSISGAAAHRVVVATSGGDYTSISAALAAITPTAADPYVIDVMPGTYTENVTMKSYVHLRGTGWEVTTLQSPSPSNDVVTLNSLTNVAISGVTINGGFHGIYNYSSSPTISGNTIGNSYNGIYNAMSSSPTISENMITGNSSNGILNSDSSSPTISGNTITGTGNSSNGISNSSSSSPTINGNTITGNSGTGISNSSSSPTISGNLITGNGFYGISNYGSSPTIIGNTITGNSMYGVYNNSASSPHVINNRVTSNGGTTYTDIYVSSTSVPNISFNVYDDITGTTGVGAYNVNSSGVPLPNP